MATANDIIKGAFGKTTFTVALTDSQTDVDAGDYTYHVLATVSSTVTICSRGTIRVRALNQA